MAIGDSINYNGITFKTGDKVICIISSIKINDAKIYIANQDEIDNGDVDSYSDGVVAFICQNQTQGNDSPMMFEYKYGWQFHFKPPYHDKILLTDEVTHLEKFYKDELANIVNLSFPHKEK